MTKYILINGAPRSGKDTIAKHLWLRHSPMHFERFSMPNKRAFAGMMNLDCDLWGNVEPYESRKDLPIPVLGKSYRQWQIDFSEKFMKPLYGQDIFGKLLLDRTHGVTGPVVVPDCGFQIEVDTLADYPCLLITVKRDGCDFSNDSREYVSPRKGWTHVTINNNGTLEDLARKADDAYIRWRSKN